MWAKKRPPAPPADGDERPSVGSVFISAFKRSDAMGRLLGYLHVYGGTSCSSWRSDFFLAKFACHVLGVILRLSKTIPYCGHLS